MDAFKLHQQVIDNYRGYIKSFMSIKDVQIKSVVGDAFECSGFIPEPLIQFNPSFARGEKLEDLVQAGKIHPKIPAIFGTYNLYKHQVEALKVGVAGKGFVVTSGTGSGKSLTYLATIFNKLLQGEGGATKGIKAILVYPMNALINSQEEEIKKYEINYLLSFCPQGTKAPLDKSSDEQIEFLKARTTERFPITYTKYTGQEGTDIRERAKNEKPDIILTNYMMLELIMTRQSEEWMRESMQSSLQFLIFDELHTYRGRQGADVSILIRRIKNNAQHAIVCIGTSATMASGGTRAEKQRTIADVAETIFGDTFELNQIIGESLVSCTNPEKKNPSVAELITAIEKGINLDDDEKIFCDHPIVIWMENNIALKHFDDGYIERGTPIKFSEIVQQFFNLTRTDKIKIHRVVHDVLLWAERLNLKAIKQGTRRSYLPFKLHQFISQTNTVYVTLDPKASRKITIKSGRYVKGNENSDDQFIYPVLFSRYSGQDFLCVTKDFKKSMLLPRDTDDTPPTVSYTEAKGKALTEEDFPAGYLIIPDPDEEIWSEEHRAELPDSWWKENKSGRRLLEFYEFQIPHRVYFNSSGKFSRTPNTDLDQWGWFISAKLRLDPTAGIIYDDPKTNENTKLMRLGNEGRSTATTVMSYSIIDAMNQQGEDIRNQKLLSFTDNRQDASLQAGHFNDYLTTVRLRSAVYHAISDAPDGLKIFEIGKRTSEKLHLKESEYAREPNDEWPDDENERAFVDFLTIRILYDLKKGWRYVLPNLEQCALLKIEYEKLSPFCEQNKFFENVELLKHLPPSEREQILLQVLNYFRTSFAINHSVLLEKKRETEDFINLKLDNDKLWSLDRNERIEAPSYLVAQNPGKTFRVYTASMGVRSNLGKYLKRVFRDHELAPLRGDDYVEFIHSLCEVLIKGNFLKKEVIKGNKGTVSGYLLRSDKIIWKVGDSKNIVPDSVRFSAYKDLDIRPNPFFQAQYKFDFTQYKKQIFGKEHTGQLGTDDRIQRENAFRKGVISAMFCSPTMELGIDIKDLNVVHLRNVPPNPANYAQRGGRAGRSGQTALVFTYCSFGSPHDRNYFAAAEKMVAGVVVPPKIDLRNEELIRSHFNAYILMELGLDKLNVSVADVIDINKPFDLPLLPDLLSYIEDQKERYQAEWVRGFRNVIKEIEPRLDLTHWYNQAWLENLASSILVRFDHAFDRWRTLYRKARNMIERARMILDDPTIKIDSDAGWDAQRQHAIGLKQIALLKNENLEQYGNNSEFYVYRYLASEGFLPGYNFTRLPVRVFIGYKHQDQGEYISRSRFVALKEFGPQNLIYHNGNKFVINRMMLLEAEAKTRSIIISKRTGYAFLDADEASANNDPITHTRLKGETNVEVIHRLLELSESEGKPQERISCEEEERTSQGFLIDQYFSYPQGIQATKQTIIKIGTTPILNVIFGPSTELIQLNRKWKRSRDDKGFTIDNRSGKWLRQSELERAEVAEHARDVMLFARTNADSLYLQPVEDLGIASEQIITLSYALKRAIERLFQTEESEIGVWVMGDKESPNIMIYEASEGSLGILSQLIENPATFRQLFIEAYQVLHFDPETKTDTRRDLPKANYEDILSYYNQTHHAVLDRFSVKEVLEKLMECTVVPKSEIRDRDEQYQFLLESYDKNSSTELPLLNFLYANGYALPDQAQVNIPGFYISADFVYRHNHGKTYIFCDGSVHDEINQQQQDDHNRSLLRDAGEDVIEWHYSEPIEDLVKRRKDIFRKIC